MEKQKILFNRNEFSGAFGDIGTDLPLIVAIILTTGLDISGVLLMFGFLQIFSGSIYRMPIPVQPLKAMAAIVITQQIAGDVLLGAGLVIGIIMLLLSVTSSLDRLARLIPKAVIRGIQLGLGLSLCYLAVKSYISAEQFTGYLLALISFIIILIFIDRKRYPVALFVIGLGIIYAFIFKIDIHHFSNAFGINFPHLVLPSKEAMLQGFLLLALPQIPLSFGNSIVATRQVAKDLFPQRKELSIKKIGITYSLMNLVNPFFGGIPTCHGSGGMVGHYVFGGRSGGSVIIYGTFYIILGLFFADGFHDIIQVFPLPVLGVILLFEGLSLMLLVKDLTEDKRGFVIAFITGIIAFTLPYGFIVAIITGTLIYYLPKSISSFSNMGPDKPQ